MNDWKSKQLSHLLMLLATTVIIGCGSSASQNHSALPDDDGVRLMAGSAYNSRQQQRHNRVSLQHRQRQKTATANASLQPVSAISRRSWQPQPVISSRMTAMSQVKRITVHHEGNATPNRDTTTAQVKKTMRNIQKNHFSRLKAGDIGYHFVIDRAGRVWQARELKYQGAHTKGKNSGNIGIMCLGNFEIQSPTPPQTTALKHLCAALLHAYNLPPSAIGGHRDHGATACPGKQLYPIIQQIKRGAVY